MGVLLGAGAGFPVLEFHWIFQQVMRDYIRFGIVVRFHTVTLIQEDCLPIPW
ncbi:MAG: hypothetical protein IPQ03_13215 [Bacteroidetes bacterium]|nr:hypothetical protein [Bacteroidota bacterium]